MEGWIKIHRQIEEHWIWDNPIYLKAWICILLTVNHESKKVLIQGELMECNKGQSIISLGSWCKKFGKNWTMQRVRTFFELLKKDGMITTEGLRKTTRLTVCKYVDYQFTQQGDNKETTRRQQGDNNKQECKEGKECKELKKNLSPEKSGDFINDIITEFSKIYKDKFGFEYEIITKGKDRAAIGKLLNLYKKKYPGSNSNETLLSLSTYFKACVNINDPWLKNNMSPSIIVSKFNEINKILKNGTVKQKQGITDQELAGLLAAKYATDRQV